MDYKFNALRRDDSTVRLQKLEPEIAKLTIKTWSARGIVEGEMNVACQGECRQRSRKLLAHWTLCLTTTSATLATVVGMDREHKTTASRRRSMEPRLTNIPLRQLQEEFARTQHRGSKRVGNRGSAH